MLGCAVAVLGALLVLPGKAATLAWLRQWPLWQQLQEDLGLATQDWQTIQVGATTFRYHLQGEMAWPLLLTLNPASLPPSKAFLTISWLHCEAGPSSLGTAKTPHRPPCLSAQCFMSS
ncbi:unnamed protein product [Durusdinium trenchii]|uniref:Uncharacterized protein n=1 Tax=Durusdinium trenchii TaxID=1381693 RepID=A0ABP0K1T7_9DINO